MPKSLSAKRTHKLKNDSDSPESDYEWTEKPTHPEVPKEKKSKNEDWLGGLDTMENFMEVITSKPSSKSPKSFTPTPSPQLDELNPYWKDGGSGLPSSKETSNKSLLTKENEHWLLKSYQRCVERSKETYTNLEDLLLERWDRTTVDEMLRKFGRGSSRSSSGSHKSSVPRWRKHDREGVKKSPTEPPEETPQSYPSQPERSSPDTVVSTSTAESEERLVTQDDINAMAAKVMRAEMASDKAKVQKLNANLEKLREAHARGIKVRLHVIRKRSATASTPTEHMQRPSGHSKITSPATSESNVDSTSDMASRRAVEKLVHDERFISSRDMEQEFTTLYRAGRRVNDDYEDAVKQRRSTSERDAHRIKQDAVQAYKRRVYAASSCTTCVEAVPKHLILHMGKYAYLSLPDHESLVAGHCYLTPFEHVGSVTRLDRNCVEELCKLKRQVVAVCARHLDGSGCVFVETATNLDSPRCHTRVECIPVPMDLLKALPAYFKKALSEIGSEWGQNTRVISLPSNGMGAFSSVPPKLPYFAVEFGLSDGGLARVIDDRRDMTSYFGKEIIGEALDLDNHLWRKPKSENFDCLRKKIVQFESWWDDITGRSSGSDVPVNLTDPEGPALPPDFCN